MCAEAGGGGGFLSCQPYSTVPYVLEYRISPSKKKVVRVQRVTSFGRVYGMARNWHECVCSGNGTMSTIRRDLPIPVLYETIPTSGA